VASPNPESNENKDKTAIKDDPSANEHQRARDTTRLYDVAVQEDVAAYDHERRSAEERYWKWQVRWQAIGALATIAAFAAAAIYVHYEKQQVGQAIAANRNATIALHTAERPYMALGRPDGRIMEFRSPTDAKKLTAIAIYFNNGGKGPAFRFMTNSWTVITGKQVDVVPTHLERWQDLTLGGIQELGGGPTVSGGAVHTEFIVGLPYALTTDEIRDVQAGTKMLLVSGSFEYCDQFGNYVCKDFGARYIPELRDFVSNGFARDCAIAPPAHPVARYMGKPIEFKLLSPCNETEQQEQRDPYDKNLRQGHPIHIGQAIGNSAVFVPAPANR
jgi:hypothetical protein